VSILGFMPCISDASVVPTEKMTYDREADLARIQVVLEKKVVAQRLADFGLTQAEVNHRLDRLTDEQVHQIAAEIDELAPGGQETFIILLLLILIVVLLWYFDIIDIKKPEKKDEGP
jgi:ribose 1,5-bisphosphokinase PhnN